MGISGLNTSQEVLSTMLFCKIYVSISIGQITDSFVFLYVCIYFILCCYEGMSSCGVVFLIPLF